MPFYFGPLQEARTIDSQDVTRARRVGHKEGGRGNDAKYRPSSDYSRDEKEAYKDAFLGAASELGHDDGSNGKRKRSLYNQGSAYIERYEEGFRSGRIELGKSDGWNERKQRLPNDEVYLEGYRKGKRNRELAREATKLGLAAARGLISQGSSPEIPDKGN